MNNDQTILAIDTSCDDTSVAVTRGTVVLSNVVASQAELHKPYGGVFPTVAKQAHNENILPAVKLSLKRALHTWDNIDLIAVTQGPGLAPALEVGIKAAIELSKKHNKPLIPINHVEGHILSVHARPKSKVKDKNTSESKNNSFKLPALSIIISGKTSQFILVTKNDRNQNNNPFSYKIIGTSVDDAAGECLDKVGRMLSLGYPAGPVIETLAKDGDPNSYTFPLPMTTTKNYNLSFSGLKTFARNLIEKEEEKNSLNKTQIVNMCASLQKAVFRHICYKLNKILEKENIEEIWLGGGVSSNTTLRRMIRNVLKSHSQKKIDIKNQIPLKAPYAKKLCSDNAAMIGVAAGYKNLSKLEPTHDLDRKPRWNVEQLCYN